MNLMLIGHSGSGKDCIHSLLPKYHRIALADPIRNIVKTLRDRGVGAAFAESIAILGDSAPNDLMYILRFYSQIPRTSKEKAVLQGIGMYFVECQDDVWIKQGQAKIIKGSNVITDIRRLSEFNHFKSLGFRSIYVECPEELRVQRLHQRDGGYNESSAKHKSESEIESLKPLCNSIVTNNGTLEELKVAVDGAVAWLQFTMAN